MIVKIETANPPSCDEKNVTPSLQPSTPASGWTNSMLKMKA
jgi:hypothetical protein